MGSGKLTQEQFEELKFHTKKAIANKIESVLTGIGSGLIVSWLYYEGFIPYTQDVSRFLILGLGIVFYVASLLIHYNVSRKHYKTMDEYTN